MISESDAKNDPADARLLARLAHVGPDLLSPIQQRSEKTQMDLALVRARDVAVQTRTKIISAVRGIVKSTEVRLRPALPAVVISNIQFCSGYEIIHSPLF